MRFFLGTIALSIFLTPFLLAYRQAQLGRQISEQVVIPITNLSPAQFARYAAFGNRANGNVPIVLTYRDIRPSQADQEARPDTVTTAAFSTHLAMLKAAGYSTLSAEQLARYLGGQPIPARSIVLTFDGGLQGTWVYVDRMLREHGFRGIAFIPTNKIGEHRSRYLTWAELRRMHVSGRWDIGSQGPDPDATIQLAPNGRSGNFYSVRAWLPDKRRRETATESRGRLRRALSNDKTVFVQHGLPSPRLLSGVPVGSTMRRGIADLYDAVFADSELPSSVSRRDTASRSIHRLSIRRETTAAQLFQQLASMTPLPVTSRSPAQDPRRWYINWNREGKVEFTGEDVIFESSWPGRLEARYAPQASEDWTNYAVQVEVGGLRSQDTATTAGLTILDGSRGECDVRVSSAHMDLFCPGRGLFHRRALPRRSSHRLDVRVSQEWLFVSVDGSRIDRLPLPAAQPVSGGFGLSIYRAQADIPIPQFHRLKLMRLPGDAGSKRLGDAPQAGARASDDLDERGT